MANPIPVICGRSRVKLPRSCTEGTHFVGVTDETVIQGNDFDLRAGVSALSEDGELEYTVTPDTFIPCQVGAQEFEYVASDGTTANRTITVQSMGAPVIDGLTDIHVFENEDFDPMDGVSAHDGRGNPVPVEFVGEEVDLTVMPTETKTFYMSKGYVQSGDTFTVNATSYSNTDQAYEHAFEFERGRHSAKVVSRTGAAFTVDYGGFDEFTVECSSARVVVHDIRY